MARVQYGFKQMSVYEIYRLSELGYLKLHPPYQRQPCWTLNMKMALLDSIFRGFPINPVILQEYEAGRYEVIDGAQRLSTIIEFINNKFGIRYPEGKIHYFKELAAMEQRKLEDYTVLSIIVSGTVEENVARDIFLNINVRGKSLTPQEIRKAKYAEKGMPFVEKLAQMEVFKKVVHKMGEERRQKLVLRFLAFSLKGYEGYDGKIAEFLDSTLENYEKFRPFESQIEKSFMQMCRCVQVVWPVDAFMVLSGKGKKKRFSQALFDIISYSFTQFPEAKLIDSAEQIRQALEMLLAKNAEFRYAVTDTGNAGKKKVSDRFAIWMDTMKNIVGG